MKPMNDFLSRQVKLLAVGLIVAAGTAYESAPARAGGNFIGGLVAGHVVGGFVRRDKQRTQAQMYQAYKPQQPTYQQPAPQYSSPPPQTAVAPAPSAPPHESVVQCIKRLEVLAAKCIICKEVFHDRRQAILNSI